MADETLLVSLKNKPSGVVVVAENDEKSDGELAL